MKLRNYLYLVLVAIITGCTSSTESTRENITNTHNSRYYYIKQLDSYIIVPSNFATVSSTGDLDSTTGAYLSWVRKKNTLDYWVSELDSYFNATIERHKETEPTLVESYQRSDLMINGDRSVLFTCDMYWDNDPDKQFTYRLLMDRADSIDEYVGNVVSYRKASVQDSLLFSLRSIIP
jgi:hypothetical protein